VLGKKNQSSVVAKYFAMYKKNPRSKVFAPLAESLRKMGMLEDAYKILKEGIRNHPNYTLGYVVLAHCYFDQNKFEQTYSTLRPIIAQNTDNISLQKIFAQACMNLGYLEEALDTYKYLLFINPRDKFFSEMVKKLEDDLMIGHKKLTLDQLVKAPDMIKQVSSQGLEDDWVQVNFLENGSKKEEIKNLPEKIISHPEDWKVGSINHHPLLEEKEVVRKSLDDEYFADEFEEELQPEEVHAPQAGNPIISHTLIDLYCRQNYYDKAIELLDRIIELNPTEESVIEKRKSVLKQKNDYEMKLTSSDIDKAHDELITIIETKVKQKSPNETRLEKIFENFLILVRQRAQHFSR
jgi:pentatricopeptide repeat protein